LQAKATDPSANSAQSNPFPFTVNNAPPAGTVVVTGVLQLPPPLNPSDFLVGNQFAQVTPDNAGNFAIPAFEQGVTVTSAVPNTYTDGENMWLAVLLKFPDQIVPANGPAITIDASSTAKGMVAIHPFFMTPDPYKLKRIFVGEDMLLFKMMVSGCYFFLSQLKNGRKTNDEYRVSYN
jgi:hypothetical protein